MAAAGQLDDEPFLAGGTGPRSKSIVTSASRLHANRRRSETPAGPPRLPGCGHIGGGPPPLGHASRRSGEARPPAVPPYRRRRGRVGAAAGSAPSCNGSSDPPVFSTRWCTARYPSRYSVIRARRPTEDAERTRRSCPPCPRRSRRRRPRWSSALPPAGWRCWCRTRIAVGYELHSRIRIPGRPQPNRTQIQPYAGIRIHYPHPAP